MTEQDYSEFTEDKNSHKLIKIHETEESTDFFRSDELLSTICHMTLSHSRILNTFYAQKQRISLRSKAEKDFCES